MIVMDAIDRPRPGGGSLAQQVAYCRRHYPQLLLMADIASVAQAREAEHLGFDVIGTTLYGYTDASRGRTLTEHDFVFLRAVLAAVSRPVIAEGNVLTPAMAARCLQLGCHAVVVGGAITRPQQITARFVSAMETGNDASAGNEDSVTVGSQRCVAFSRRRRRDTRRRGWATTIDRPPDNNAAAGAAGNLFLARRLQGNGVSCSAHTGCSRRRRPPRPK